MRMLGGLGMVVAVAAAAHAANYVPNAGFESCSTTPASWAAVGTESLACDGTTPATGSYDLALSNGMNAMLTGAQSDCVVVSPGTSIDDFSFAYRTSAVTVYQVALTVDFFTSSDCTGTSGSDSTGAGVNYGATLMRDGGWHTTTPRTVTIDPGINSIQFTASFQAQAAQLTSTVDFDDLSFSTNATTTTTQPSGSTTTTTTTSVDGTTTSTTIPTITGKGNPASECFVTVTGLAAASDGHVECVDGDPACDADGVADGACVFAFQVCVAETLAGCQVSSITAVTAKPASLQVALPTVPASAPTCGPETQVTVPLVHHGRRPGRRMLTLTADNTGEPKHERDRIRFVCRPHRG
jgi:hypothetical protein